MMLLTCHGRRSLEFRNNSDSAEGAFDHDVAIEAIDPPGKVARPLPNERLYGCEREGDIVTEPWALVAWLALAVVLVAVELHHLAFFALFGAVGALAGAAVSAVAPHQFGAQGGAAVIVCVVGMVLVRPYVSRAFLRPRGTPAAVGVHGGFVGQRVVALDSISERSGGHVLLAGETWLARTPHDTTIVKDSFAVVTSVEGTTLIVGPPV